MITTIKYGLDKVICIKDCENLLTFHDFHDVGIKKGEIFLTDKSNLNLTHIRLIKDLKIIAICDNSNFMKLDEYRNYNIDNLLD